MDLLKSLKIKKEELTEPSPSEVLNSSLSVLKNDSVPVVLNAYLTTLLESDRVHFSIVRGRGGVGKTYDVLAVLKSKGLQAGKDFALLNTHVTPLGLYNFLYENKDKVVVLDDCDSLLRNKVLVALLKACTWSPTSVRLVSWLSTTAMLQAPSSFEFKGKVILIANDLPKGEDLSALLTRGFDFVYSLSLKDTLGKLKSIALAGDFQLSEKEKLDVYNVILKHASLATEELNVRTLVKAMSVYKHTLNSEVLNESVSLMLKPDVDVQTFLSIEESLSEKPVAVRAREFSNRTGLSRASYFRIKKKVLEEAKP